MNGDWIYFGLNGVEMFQGTLLGQPLWKYAASALHLVLAIVLSRILGRFTNQRLRRYADKRPTKFNDLLLAFMSGPVKVSIFVLILHLEFHVFDWPQWVEEYVKTGLKLAIAIAVSYAALKCVDIVAAFLKRPAEEKRNKAFDEQLTNTIRNSLKFVVIIVIALSAAQNVGFNVTGVLASMSIGGLALGLAAKDILANLFGAVFLFVDMPFHVGDRIRVNSVDGFVEAIGLRCTRVRDREGHLVTVPNRLLTDSTIVNVSRSSNIRTEINLGLGYDTSPERLRRAMQILDQVFRNHRMTEDVRVNFSKIGEYAFNIRVVHVWKSANRREYRDGMQELYLEVLRWFKREKIGIASPTRTVNLRQDEEWRPGSQPR